MMGHAYGIDVHKQTVVVARHGAGDRPRTIARTPQAIRTLARRLRRAEPTLVVLEPSGGYERLVLEALQDEGVPVARVPARRIRAYAYGLGQQAKTDALDAAVLARYAAEAPVPPSRMRPPLERQLMDVVDQRRHYVALAAAERSWRAHQPAAGAARADDLLTALTAVIAALEAELRALIQRAPDLRARVELLTSCPGVGEQTAIVLVTDVPELGEATAKEVAALVGVAPCTSESGQARRAARIQGRRATVRPYSSDSMVLPTPDAYLRGTHIASCPGFVIPGNPYRKGTNPSWLVWNSSSFCC